MMKSVSLSAWPVRMATTTASRSIFPRAVSLRNAASVVADAGSQPMPSRPIIAFASAISSSVTSMTKPLLCWTARSAFFHERGLPMRIAVAAVSGCSTGVSSAAPERHICANGLAPSA